MKSPSMRTFKNLALRIGSIFVALGAFLVSLVVVVSCWVIWRFGYISILVILTHMGESPSVLPKVDLLVLSMGLLVSLFVGLSVGVLAHAFLVWSFSGGFVRAVASHLGFILLSCYILYGIFDCLDPWFALRYEIHCLQNPSDFFKENFVSQDARDVKFPAKKYNLILIVSESLELGFSEGMTTPENLLPELSAWREKHSSISFQRQISGVNYTSAALTSMMYGVPRMLLDGVILHQDISSCPRIKVTSIWDVFLEHGYECRYVQGGTFSFGAKGSLFPKNTHLVCRGYEDYRNDPAYLREPDKHTYGVNDEVLFAHLREETLEVAGTGKPFVLMALTMNPHNPEGWSSAFSERRHEKCLENSILNQDHMICQYLEWVESQSFAEETVVVVAGDHLFWGGTWLPINKRTTFNAISLPQDIRFRGEHFKKKRTFATFDWAPTFIELVGGVLPGDGSLGLGKSLLRETPTILEEMSVEEYEREIRRSHADYCKIVLD